jgi:tRNA threonylcarbamoyladenosine modification (KEOPS) complex  Pcc1 subunit
MPDNSFDIVSKIELQEVSNAIQQALKEIHTRFDLKDSKSNIELEKDAIVLHSADEYKLKAVNDILQQKAGQARRFVEGIDLRRGRTRDRGNGEAQGHDAAGHRHRKSARDREAGQGFEEESAGFDPGRPGADQQQGPRHAAGSDRHAAASTILGSICSLRIIGRIRGKSTTEARR